MSVKGGIRESKNASRGWDGQMNTIPANRPEGHAVAPGGGGILRVGLDGAGTHADWHARVLRKIPGVRLQAVCDLDLSKASQLRQRWGIPQAYSSLERMLEPGDLDVVHVVTPPAFHASGAVQCLEAGCHVFLEKPAGVSVFECEQIESAVARSGRRLGVNHNLTFNPAFLGLVRAVQERRLGRIEHVTVCFNTPMRLPSDGRHWIFQNMGNIVLESGPHPLSMVYRLIGKVRHASTVTSGETVLANGRTFYGSWQTSLLAERGTAQCFLSFGAEHMDLWIHVVGQDGAAFADLRRNTLRISEKSRFLPQIDDLADSLRNGGSICRQGASNLVNYALAFLGWKSPRDTFYSAMHGSMSAFYGALGMGKDPPIGMEEGRGVIDACEALIRGGERFVAESGALEGHGCIR
jgi:predicted dehydrogenase